MATRSPAYAPKGCRARPPDSPDGTDQPDDLSLRLYRPLEAPQHALRAKVFRSGPPLALSDLLPLFEDMGVEVADERPYAISPRDRESIWIYDFGLTYSGEIELEADRLREEFRAPFSAHGAATPGDGYNRLCCEPDQLERATVLRDIGRSFERPARLQRTQGELALVGHRASRACWWNGAGPLRPKTADPLAPAVPRRYPKIDAV